MKLLFYNFNSYLDPDICEILSQMNIKYDTFRYDFDVPPHDKNRDDAFVSMFLKSYNPANYDAVFSVDYWPPIAEACHQADTKYIAWSYDCPLDIKNPEETLVYSNVFCFLFDKTQASQFQSKGFSNVFYMPLGINSSRYRQFDSYKKKCDPYRTDVAFVGKLYENSFPLIANLVNEKTRDVLNQVISMQRKMPSTYILDTLITDNLVSLISDEMHASDPEFTDTVTKNKILYALESQIAQIDRITMLNIAGLNHKVNFYTGSKSQLLKNVTCCPKVNYWTEMPWVFAASKVNINPSLPSIRSGMNLRSFDITASGGFLLMNRQSELDDFFIENKEVVVYDSIEDYAEKLEYYLSHESVRAEIAKAGRNRCLSDHNIIDRLVKIFSISSVS